MNFKAMLLLLFLFSCLNFQVNLNWAQAEVLDRNAGIAPNALINFDPLDYVDECETATRLLERALADCMRNYTGPFERATTCIERIFPTFRERKPFCRYEGSLVCQSVCLEYYTGPWEPTSACDRACNNTLGRTLNAQRKK